MTKSAKILIDICLILLLLLLFLTEDFISIHTFLGYALIPVIIMHLLLNGKWLAASTRKLFNGKLTWKSRYMYGLFVGLAIAFSVCIGSGIALLYSSISFICELHEISAYICVVLVILHVQVHWKYIKSFFISKPRAA